jgi:hypothetical protein
MVFLTLAQLVTRPMIRGLSGHDIIQMRVVLLTLVLLISKLNVKSRELGVMIKQTAINQPEVASSSEFSKQ